MPIRLWQRENLYFHDSLHILSKVWCDSNKSRHSVGYTPDQWQGVTRGVHFNEVVVFFFVWFKQIQKTHCVGNICFLLFITCQLIFKYQRDGQNEAVNVNEHMSITNSRSDSLLFSCFTQTEKKNQRIFDWFSSPILIHHNMRYLKYVIVAYSISNHCRMPNVRPTNT